MNKAVFIDRDGVINSDVGHYYIFKPEDFVLNEGIITSLKRLQDAGFLLVIITNQGGINKGEYTHADVKSVHAKMLRLFAEHGITIEDIYYCPHHDKFQKCMCRKPLNLNIEKAIHRFNIDRTQSWFIGDSVRDIQAGEASSLKTVKLNSNENLLPYIEEIVNGIQK